MSMTTVRSTRRAAFAVAAAALFGTAALAQPPRPADPLGAAEARQKIADQKAEADVLTAIQEADRTARTNKARAAQVLRAAQNNIDLSGAISGNARKTLTALIQSRLAALDEKPVAVVGGAKPEPTAATVKADQKTAFEAYTAEIKEVREGVEAVARFQEANRHAEADRTIAALNAKYPNNPAVIALTQKDSFGKAVADSRLFAKMQGERILYAQNDLMRSSLPVKGDIEFPANWKELTERRKKAEPQLSAKERSLIAALDQPVTVAFNNRPLEEVLQDLSNQMDQSLFLDRKSIEDQGVDLTRPVMLDAKGISARTVLRQVLAAQGLTFVVKDEAIQVVTVEKAREMLVTRVYYLGDLIQGVGPFGGALQWGPLLDFQQTQANAAFIADSITKSIDPLSWKERGGPGTVTFHFPSMSLIVRASSEVHATLGSKLGGGR
jgi:hypothetical protein